MSPDLMILSESRLPSIRSRLVPAVFLGVESQENGSLSIMQGASVLLDHIRSTVLHGSKVDVQRPRSRNKTRPSWNGRSFVFRMCRSASESEHISSEVQEEPPETPEPPLRRSLSQNPRSQTTTRSPRQLLTKHILYCTTVCTKCTKQC
jgi:hypothetical protein